MWFPIKVVKTVVYQIR